MKGRVLNYVDLEGTGLISGDDGVRYAFTRGDLQAGLRTISQGADVDFEVVDGRAAGVFQLAPAHQAGRYPTAPGYAPGYAPGHAPGAAPGHYVAEKSRVTAALLAFFLGGLGIHKFYLGRTGAGMVMLMCVLFGWILLFIPPLVIGIIAFIEFIIYLTKTDAEFHQEYVVGQKSWF